MGAPELLTGAFGWVSTRDGAGSSLMSEMSSSHLMFGWMDEVIPVFCKVWNTHKDERGENYYLIVFQIIINNTLINIC
jgi:hypothetical protein